MRSEHDLRLPEIGPRLSQVERATKYGIGITAASLCIWLLLAPDPYFLVVGLAAALVVLLTLSPLVQPDLFRLLEHTSPPDRTRINLAGPLICTAGALFVRAIVDYDLVDVGKLIVLGALGGFAHAALLWVLVRRASLVLSALVGVWFSPATLLHVNGATLPMTGYEERGVVVRKYTSTKPRRNAVVVALSQNEVTMSTDSVSYLKFKAGQQVCVLVRTGAIGLRVRNFTEC